jgi:uncharacterized protein
MTISMYDASVPVFIRALTNLSEILRKAMAHAAEKNVDLASTLFSARLIEDMHPFSAQIQIATDSAKGCGARLAGMEVPRFPDEEKTFPELVARIERTIAFLRTIEPSKIEGSETRDITLKFPQITFNFVGKEFLFEFALPNFFFHHTMAYALLRKNGVPLGKADFLGGR